MSNRINSYYTREQSSVYFVISKTYKNYIYFHTTYRGVLLTICILKECGDISSIHTVNQISIHNLYVITGSETLKSCLQNSIPLHKVFHKLSTSMIWIYLLFISSSGSIRDYYIIKISYCVCFCYTCKTLTTGTNVISFLGLFWL